MKLRGLNGQRFKIPIIGELAETQASKRPVARQSNLSKSLESEAVHPPSPFAQVEFIAAIGAIGAEFRKSCLTIPVFRAFLILFQLHAHGAYPRSGYPLLLTLV
jgi:hypothetical protein